MKILLIVALLTGLNANSSTLTKVSEPGVTNKTLPGYDFDSDQVFKINTGPLQNATIFFAFKAPGKLDVIPRFVVVKGGVLLDSIEIPTLELGWNIVSVQALSAEAVTMSESITAFAILTIEPISGRESDYWDQGFIFTITKDGKIDPQKNINLKIAQTKPAIKNIKALKAYLKINSTLLKR